MIYNFKHKFQLFSFFFHYHYLVGSTYTAIILWLLGLWTNSWKRVGKEEGKKGKTKRFYFKKKIVMGKNEAIYVNNKN